MCYDFARKIPLTMNDLETKTRSFVSHLYSFTPLHHTLTASYTETHIRVRASSLKSFASIAADRESKISCNNRETNPKLELLRDVSADSYKSTNRGAIAFSST